MFSGASLLMVGSSGPEVKTLQENLLALGFKLPKYGADGIFGSETEQAVKSFQYTWGNLVIDGIVGPQTSAALSEALYLLSQGQWNPSTDPVEYYPGAESVSVVPQPTTTSQVIPIQSQRVISTTPSKKPLIAGFDINYLLIGGAAILGFMLLTGRKEIHKERVRVIRLGRKRKRR